MSTDLYGVRVLGLEPKQRKAKLRVFVVYYDVHYKNHQPLSDDASFFFRFLGDWHPGADDGAIRSALVGDQLFDEAFVDSNAWRFVESVRLLETRNEPVTDWSAFHDFYYERNGKWQDEQKLVQADYELTVTDARWIAHWKKGASWGSTSYPTKADRITAADAPSVPDFRLEEKRLIPFMGERETGTPENAFFSDDGALLAVTSQHGAAVVYDTKTWKETMRTEDAALFPDAEFFPNGHVLAMRWRNGKEPLRAWNAKTGEPGSVTLAPGRLRSPSGTLRAEFGDSGRLELLAENGAKLRVIETPHETCEAAAFTPDERHIATAGMANEVCVWRCHDGAKVAGGTLGEERIGHLGFSPDGRWLVFSGKFTASVANVKTGQIVRQRSGDTYACEIAWSKTGLVAVTHVGAAMG